VTSGAETLIQDRLELRQRDGRPLQRGKRHIDEGKW